MSDRRLRAGEKIGRAAAFVRGGPDVQPIDLEALQWVLWSVPDQAATAAQKIVARANPLGAKLDALLAETDEVARAANDAATRVDAVTKLQAILNEAKKVAAEPGANGRAAKVVTYVQKEYARIQGAVLGLPADKIEKMFA